MSVSYVRRHFQSLPGKDLRAPRLVRDLRNRHLVKYQADCVNHRFGDKVCLSGEQRMATSLRTSLAEEPASARIHGADRPAGRAGPAGADDRGAGLISGWQPLIIQL